MPVKAVGKKVIKIATGKVEQTCRSHAKALAAARIINSRYWEKK